MKISSFILYSFFTIELIKTKEMVLLKLITVRNEWFTTGANNLLKSSVFDDRGYIQNEYEKNQYYNKVCNC